MRRTTTNTPATSTSALLLHRTERLRSNAYLFLSITFLLLTICVAGCRQKTQPDNRDDQDRRRATVNGPSATPPPQARPDTAPHAAAPPPAKPNDTSDVQGAVDLLQNYYDAIDRHDYERAYRCWEGNGAASGKSFKDFTKGFSKTASAQVAIDSTGRIEGAAGLQYVTLPVTITATTAHRKEQQYKGVYVLRRTMVDGATSIQRAWRIYTAKIKGGNG